MSLANHLLTRPAVRLVGEIDHPDFGDAVALLRADARLLTSAAEGPELIVIAQSRPDAFSHQEVLLLQREAPLAGVVGLLSSWCEGETRTGRPWPGVERLYWYHFPAWWRRQLALRAIGRCPEWARRGDFGLRGADSEYANRRARGVVVLNTAWRETAAALSDVLQRTGYATVWQPPGRPAAVVRGAAAGIWDGGQLSERETGELAAFCRKLNLDGAPVIALLDFPRRDSVDLARQVGAAVVLGKPWLNADLAATIRDVATDWESRQRAAIRAA